MHALRPSSSLRQLPDSLRPLAAPRHFSSASARPSIPTLRRFTRSKASTALVLNAGSSSLKYGLFQLRAGGEMQSICAGGAERIGQRGALIAHKDSAGSHKVEAELESHEHALSEIVALLTSEKGPIDDVSQVAVVGHRVVHGGAVYSTPVVIDAAVERTIEQHIPLAPLHNPANLLGIRVARQLFPCPHVAVFDTAFHASIPAHNYMYALPSELHDDHGVRRYGFHGTSYTYVLQQTAKLLHRPAEELNLILLHLGNGASMAAVRRGVGLDTSMGLTPLEGLVMGTRAGDVDAGVTTFLASHLGYSAEAIDKLLNKQSGLLGMCGTSDMRSVKAKADQGDAPSILARRVTIERIRKYLGAYLLKLEGDVDAIVFTGGIGENDAELRQEVCADLTRFGISIDPTKNALGLSEVQSSFASIKCMVVPTDEEVSIAQQAVEAAAIQPPPATPQPSAPLPRPKEAARPAAAPSRGKVPPLGHAVLIESDKATALWEAALLSSVLPRSRQLGYFRLLSHGEGRDRKLDFMRSSSKLGLDKQPFDAMIGMHVDSALSLYARGRSDEIFGTIIDKFKAYAADKDFVLVCGERITARGSVGAPGSSGFYAQLAAALNIPVLIAHDVTLEVSGDALEAKLAGIKAGYAASAVRLAGAIIAGLPAKDFERAERAVRKSLDHFGIYPAALLPHDERIHQLTMAEVAEQLDAKVLFGEKNVHTQFVQNVDIGTMQVPDLLAKLQNTPGTLVVTAAARAEVLLSLIFAARSSNTPLHPGVVLTGASSLPSTVQHVLDGVHTIGKPVLITQKSSYEAATLLYDLQRSPHPLASGYAKCEVSEAIMEKHLDADFLDAMVGDMPPADDLSPIVLKHNMFTAARKSKQRIVLPEGDDLRIVTAAADLLTRGLCDVTLLGDPKAVRALAEQAHVSIDGAAIIHPDTVLKDEQTSWGDEMVRGLCEARKKTGMTLDAARELLRSDPAYFGTMMMLQGKADGMVSGACHSTANTMRPALQLIKTAPGFSLVSSVFFMLLRDKVYVYGDCAINVDPTAEQLAEIAVASAQTARAFGVTPRVAMLSYASGDSNQGPMIDKVRKATELARKLAPHEFIEGPIQFDAAVDPAVAAVKYKGAANPVAGKATVCIFPDLNSGNNGYKAVQQASKTSAVGPIMQGLRMPVNDLSRGCTVEDVVNTAVCTALQAISAKQAATSRD
ncbi:hypothetical protein AB1Y20_007935 [Prymnesium parvum]|uniref:Probable acetate kinase n=1 Tax=Prymnesium parvum TaxID=97485 RepID=A0AB34IU47_PRYPA